MVFHYFGNKLGLYEFLSEFAGDFVRKYFGDLENQMKDLDFIERFQFMTKVKLQAYTDNPYVFEFFTMSYLHPVNVSVSEKTMALWNEIYALREHMLSSENFPKEGTRFRKDLDLIKTKNYIMWIFEGYSQDILKKIKGKSLADVDLDPYWKEFDEILNDLRMLFYQQ